MNCILVCSISVIISRSFFAIVKAINNLLIIGRFPAAMDQVADNRITVLINIGFNIIIGVFRVINGEPAKIIRVIVLLEGSLDTG